MNATPTKPRPRTALVGVYRARNAGTAGALVEMAGGLGLTVALWALDEPTSGLSDVTVGVGPGARTALLQRLLDALGTLPEEVVLADDDVRFVSGDLGALLALCREAGFGLAQPAHAKRSQASHAVTRRRRLSVARRTTFVEIGPVCVLREPWLERLLPLPDDFGMGWGLDVLWSDLARQGLPMGVIDAVTVEHLGAVASEYDIGPEAERLNALLAARGVGRIEDLMHVLGTWRPWRRGPPWTPSPGGAGRRQIP